MPDGAARSVASALDEIARWRSDAEAKNRTELSELDQEIESLNTAIANLQQQIDALRRNRQELARREEKLAEDEMERSYNAIFAAMTGQTEAVAKRARAVADSQSARDAALAKALEGGEAAALLAEYNQFKSTVEPTLAALPESYRSVILQHHQGVSEKLRAHVEAAVGAVPAGVEGDELAVDVVFAVDAPEGTPELLMMILPVQEEAHSAWASRREDAQTWLAARAVQAMHAACKAAGVAEVRPAFGPHQGLLALEAEVPGASADLASKVEAELARVLAGAKELQGAKIAARPRQVVVDHLFPPEEDEVAEEVGGA